MKKTYQKPEIAFDCFTVSTSIAGNCAITDVTHTDEKYGCGYNDFMYGKVVFTEAMGCTTTPDDGPYNTICYHPPAGSNLFNS